MGEATGDERRSDAPSQTLGEFLRNARVSKKLTLRDVEDASEGKVSNAYLSQLENDKISKPSPHMLYALAEVYGFPYETLMRKAGYIRDTPVSQAARKSRQKGALAAYALGDLTDAEEEELLAYLAYLRSRRPRK